MKNKHIVLAGVVTALVFLAAQASATVQLVKTSTKTKGATTIKWDSGFQDLDYTIGDTITLTVNWTVDAGAASYDSFVLRHFTPKSRKDPANGSGPVVTSQVGNSLTATFHFFALHLDKRRDVEIGNVHLKLYLRIDKDGDGEPETLAGFGVNLHVEDPQ
ncbi:MAG: hypothetical protein ACE5D3_00075 [Candidatus Binatia bacterium]